MAFPRDKAQSIRLLILDVDGILTSGHLYYDDKFQTEIKAFHTRDGFGILLLQKTGIPVAIISGRPSHAVARRAKALSIAHCYLNCPDKLPVYVELKRKLGLTDDQIAYMGDDFPDLPLLRRVGLACTIKEAPAVIRQLVDYVCEAPGGSGAVREVCDLIMQSQNTYESVIKSYFA